MLSVREAKIALKQLGLPEEQINKYEELIIPHLDFHKFLMEKLDISSENVENLSKSYSKDYIETKLADLVKNGEDLSKIDSIIYFKLSGEAMKSLALENGYDTEKSQILEDNLIEVLNIFINVTKNLTEKDLLNVTKKTKKGK